MYLWFISPSRYELTMAALAVAMIVASEAASKAAPKKVSRLAVFSFVWGVANPTIVHVVFRRLGLPWIALGDSELRAWFAGTLAVVLGVLALRKMARSGEHLSGKIVAWIGIVSGAAWSLGWLYFGLRLAMAFGRRGGGP